MNQSKYFVEAVKHEYWVVESVICPQTGQVGSTKVDVFKTETEARDCADLLRAN